MKRFACMFLISAHALNFTVETFAQKQVTVFELQKEITKLRAENESLRRENRVLAARTISTQQVGSGAIDAGLRSMMVFDTNLCSRVRMVSAEEFGATRGIIKMTIRNNDVYFVRNILISVTIFPPKDGKTSPEFPKKPLDIWIDDLIPPGGTYEITEYRKEYAAIFRENGEALPFGRTVSFERVLLPSTFENQKNGEVHQIVKPPADANKGR